MPAYPRYLESPPSSEPLRLRVLLPAMAGIAIAAGVLIGLGQARWLIAACIVACALVLGARRPVLSLLLGLCLVFEVVPAHLQPSIMTAQGSIKLPDLWLAYLGLVITLGAFARGRLVPPAGRPFALAIGFFMLLVLLSFSYSWFYLGNKAAVSEARELILWCLMPLLAAVLDRPRRLRLFVAGLLWIGAALSLLALAQSLAGVQLATAMRVAPLSAEFRDVTRVITGGGIYIVAFGLIYCALQAQMAARRPIWLWPLLLLLLAGLLISFGRGMWIATCIGLFSAVMLVRGWRGAARAALAGLVLLSMLLAVLALSRPSLVQAFIDRGSGITSEIANGASFKWRGIENREALKVIAERPLLGTGIGGDYKKFSTGEANFDIEKRYIHSAYLFFPLKFGLPGLLFPVFVIVSFFRLALRSWRAQPPDPLLLAATIGAFLVPLITSFTQPEWVKAQGIAAFCCLIALLCANQQPTVRETLQ